MKIILDNIKYKGYQFDRYELEIPDVEDLDDIPEEKITERIIDSLEHSIEHYRK